MQPCWLMLGFALRQVSICGEGDGVCCKCGHADRFSLLGGYRTTAKILLNLIIMRKVFTIITSLKVGAHIVRIN